MSTSIGRSISVGWASVAAILGLGCSVRHMAPGTYEGHRDIPYGGSNTIIKDQLNTVTLTVRADGTADLSDSGIPIQGHIDYGSDSATFIPQTTVMGRPVDPETEKNFTVPLKPSGTSDWLYGNLLLKKR